MKRGEIHWANLPNPAGSGPGYRRPVLVIQSNPFNNSRIATAIVAVITSNLALAEAPGNVRLSRKASGLPKASVVNVSQLITLDRQYFGARLKSLGRDSMTKVDAGLALVLGI